MSAHELCTVLEGLAWFSLGSAVVLYVRWAARWCPKPPPPWEVRQTWRRGERWVRCPRCSRACATHDVVRPAVQEAPRACAVCPDCRLRYQVLPVDPAEPPEDIA